MIKIEGNRKVLYQWDLNQRVALTNVAVGTQVHFFNNRYQDLNDECLAVYVYNENGNAYANIPNILLQKNGSIFVYIYIEHENKAYTEHRAEIVVLARPKPSGYIYTETEVWTVDAAIKKAIAEIKENGEFNDKDVKPYILPIASADILGGVKVGEGLSIAGDGTLHTLSDGESEGEYELIETITLDEDTKRIVRTEDLNGNEYNLSSLFVFIKFPFAEETKDYGYLNVQLDTKTIKRAYAQYATATKASVSTTQQLVATVYAKIKGGVSDGKNTVAMSNSLSADDRQTGVATIYVGKEKYNRVACESGTAFPAGTTIEIWGVRA